MWSRRFRYALTSVAILCGTIGVATTASHAAEAAACPGPATIADAREQLLGALQTQATQIETLLAGGQISTPVIGLFTIDISDPEAVAQRVQELREVVAGTRDEPSPLAACGGETPAIKEAYLELARLRLEFLTLPAERRAILANLARVVQAHADAAKRLNEDRREARQAGTEAAEAQAEAEATALTAQTASERELAAQRALVERARKEIADAGAAWLTRLEEQMSGFQHIAAELSDILARVDTAADEATVLDAYAQATRLWTEVAGAARAIGGSLQPLEAPKIPPVGADEIARFSGLAEWRDYETARAKLDAEYGELLKQIARKARQQSDMHYQLLSQTARLRARLLDRARAYPDADPIPLSGTTAAQLLLEVEVVPYRWRTALKIYASHVQGLLAVGDVDGMVGIARQFGTALELIAIIGALPFGGRVLSNWLRRLQSALLLSRQRPGRLAAAIWVRRLSPYLPWAFAWLALSIASRVTADTDFAWFQAVVPWLQFYVWYRVFLVVVREIMLSSRARPGRPRTAVGLQVVERSARTLALYVLFAVSTAHLVETLVGRLLAYRLIVGVAYYLGVAIAIGYAWRARRWLEETVRSEFPGRLGEIAASLCQGWRVLLFGLPLMAVLAGRAALQRVSDRANEYEFGKRLSARLFLRRVQAHPQRVSVALPLPADYLTWFDLYHGPDAEVEVSPDTMDFAKVRAAIANWLEHGDGANALALYGHRGTGKSTVLQRIAREFDGIRIVSERVRDKCTTAQGAAELVSRLLGCDLSVGIRGLLEADEKMPPTIVVLDDAHNLMLRRQGGFDAFRLLATLINANTRNLYWCSAFNLYPWAYLTQALRGAHPFQNILRVEPWNDRDIESLITLRHARTGYSLRFDDVILAADNQATDYIESRFFQVVWEQSQGIPRAALALWLRALSYHGTRTLRVGLPESVDMSCLTRFSTDALFVLAAIVRHENLTAAEAVDVSSLPESVVRHTLGIGIDFGLLERSDDRRYRLTPSWYIPLARALGGRNFVYE